MVERIRTLCKAQGTSITKLEAQLGFGNGVIGRWNKSRPSYDRLAKVADALGVTPEYLLTGENGHKNTATTNSDGNSPSDIELLNAFKSSDEATQELIRRVLGLQ